MKHYSSRYTSADDLVAVIKQRLEFEGWAVNRYGGFEDPRIGIQLMISRGDTYFCLRSFGESSPYVDYYAVSSIGQHGVIVSAASGYSDSAGFVNQPGFQSSPKCYVESGDGAGTCHFSYRMTLWYSSQSVLAVFIHACPSACCQCCPLELVGSL